MATAPIRVAIWATGNCGERALREVIKDPGFELVGVLTFTEDKAGRDAGDLCGEPATGIIATLDPEEIFALKADCVVFVPRATGAPERRVGTPVEEVVNQAIRFTEAGTNMVTTIGDFFDDGHANFTTEQRERLQAACERGNATIFASGGDPGWFTESLPLPFLNNMRRVDYIELEEFGDLSCRPSPHMLFNQMQFGRPLEEYDAHHRKAVLNTVYQPTVAVCAKLAGFEIDEWDVEWEVACARVDCEPVAGPIKAGHTAAQKLIIVGKIAGEAKIRFIQYGYMSRDLEPAWDLGPLGWRMTFEGDTPLKVDIPWSVGPNDIAKYVPSFNTNHLLNAIPFLPDAPVGIVTFAELPAILKRGPYGKLAK